MLLLYNSRIVYPRARGFKGTADGIRRIIFYPIIDKSAAA